MIIDGIEVRKIRDKENNGCVGQVPGTGVVYFNGNPYCATCFGAEILEGEHGRALIGYFCSQLLDD
ncbi:MAG: hypothetical protein ABSE82_14470 [Nitrososphaerales archaeon]|jgi:hypothetical protein